MHPAGFFFPSGELELDESQALFLDLVADAIRRIQPFDLDVDRVSVGMRSHRLVVILPHRWDPECVVAATVSPREAVVQYGCGEEHFFPDVDLNGRVWRVAADSYVAAAARFVEEILLGRVELEVSRGFLRRTTTSYWRNDGGERGEFARGAAFDPTIRNRSRRLIRLDFGAA